MYKLFTDKSELFECNISLQGASLKKSKARLVVETSDYSLLFKGEISSKGKCEIPIRKLKGLIDENTTGNIRLEVIAEDTFFTPWESDFEVDVSKKVTVEVKSQQTKKPILETKVKVKVKDEKPTITEKDHVINLFKLLIKDDRFMGDFQKEGGIKLYPIDELECFDIDYEWQFKVSEKLFKL